MNIVKSVRLTLMDCGAADSSVRSDRGGSDLKATTWTFQVSLLMQLSRRPKPTRPRQSSVGQIRRRYSSPISQSLFNIVRGCFRISFTDQRLRASPDLHAIQPPGVGRPFLIALIFRRPYLLTPPRHPSTRLRTLAERLDASQTTTENSTQKTYRLSNQQRRELDRHQHGGLW